MWEKASQTSSVPPEGVLSPTQKQLLDNGAPFQGDTCTSPMVDTSTEFKTREAPSLVTKCDTLVTDASLEGHSGHWKDEIFQGTWNKEQKLSSMNLLEVLNSQQFG